MDKQDELAAFFDMIEDFGTMSTGQFKSKYPDCESYEGYRYVQRKARAARRAALSAALDIGGGRGS